MNELQNFLNHPLVLKWGWVLLHFLWQGAFLAMLAWALLALSAGKTARLRYLLAVVCLLLMPVCPLVTWISLAPAVPAEDSLTMIQESHSPPPAASSASSERITSSLPDSPLIEPVFFENETTLEPPRFETFERDQAASRSSLIPVWSAWLERGLPWFVGLWLCGVLLLSIRLAGGWVYARRCISKGQSLRDPWPGRVRQLVARLGCTRTIRWIESTRIRVPQALGWLRPVVLVPASLFTSMSPAEIECLLLHELLHIRRHDFFVNLVQCVIETIFFYHPGVLWLSRRIRLERELACDESVVSFTADRVTYSRALLSLADHARIPKPSLAATESDLTTRIRTILGVQRSGSVSGIAVWLCLATCAVALGVLFVPDSQASSPNDVAAETAEKDQESSVNKTNADGRDETSRAYLFGKVVDKEGKPVAAADVQTSLDGQKYSTVSGSEGEFSLDVPRPGPLRNLKTLLVVAATDEGRLQGTAYLKLVFEADQRADSTEISLQPAREFGIVVRDITGEPVSGVTVRLMSKSDKVGEETTDAQGRALLLAPDDVPYQSIVAFKQGVGIDYKEFSSRGRTNLSLYASDAENPVQFSLRPSRPVKVHVVDDRQRPVPGARVSFSFVSGIPGFRGLSDEDGNVTFEMVPWNITDKHWISVAKEGYITRHSAYFHPEAVTWEVTAELTPMLTVKGQVTTPAGQPVEAAEVRVRGENYTGPNAELIDSGRTNAGGQFEFQLPPLMFYSFLATKDEFISPSQELIIYEEAPAEPLRLQLVPAMRVRGQMTMGEGRTPFGDQQIGFERQLQQTYSESAGDRELPDPDHNGSLYSLTPTHYWGTKTDAQGRFEVMLGPGDYRLNSSGNKSYEFKVEDGRELELDVHFPTDNRQTAPSAIVRRLKDGVPLAGRVVLKSDPERGVPDLRILTYPRDSYSSINVQTDAEGVFACQRAPEGTSYVYAVTRDYEQAAMKAVSPEEQAVLLSVEPWVSITGRLIDAQTGQPLGSENIQCAVEYETGIESEPIGRILSRTTKTQSDGTFTIGGLLPDCVHVIRADRVRAQGRREESVWVRVGEVTPKAGDKPVDAGDLKFETHRPEALQP